MLAIALLGGIALASDLQIGVTVDNMNAGETVSYPLVILRGQTQEQGVRAGLDGRELLYFPAFQGRYVALCEMKPGRNFVTVKAGADRLRMRVDYTPTKSPYRIRAAWMTQQPPDVNAISSRLDLNLKLLQAFFAETMWEAGYGRKTFQYLTTTDGRVDLTVLSATDLGGPKAFGPGFDESVHRGLLFTDSSHAVGVGPLATMDFSAVPDWPDSIRGAVKAFANRERSGPLATRDDLNRGTVWSGYASTLGGTLRQIGTVLGLTPTNDRQNLMGIGYTRVNRAFLAYEAPSKDQPDETPVIPSSVPKWTADDAKRLSESPWVQ